MNAIGFNSTVNQLSQVAGPALGGVLIAAFDLVPTYLVCGSAYVVSFGVLAFIRSATNFQKTTEAPWRSLLQGLAFVRLKSVILVMLSIDAASQLFGSYRALLPVFAVRLGMGADGLGILSAAPGVGSFLTVIAILATGDMRYKGLYTVFGSVRCAVPRAQCYSRGGADATIRPAAT